MNSNLRPDGGSASGDDSDGESFSLSKLRHFIYAPLRRPLLVLVPWGAIILLSIATFFLLPKRYKSSTLILIESEKVPDSFIPRVATQDRGRSLDTIRPEILSRTRLERVLDETQPFPEIKSKTAAVEMMRRVTAVNSSGSDGFTIEFVHSKPRKAQEVTERLASLFIDETVKARQQQVEGAVDFLVAQVIESRKQLEEKDEAMRKYKEERMGRLPEQLQTNLATMGMLQQELRTVEESLLFARERQESLARGSSKAASGGSAASPGGTDELVELRNRLAALRARYTDEHPDVQSLRTSIARIESRRALASSAAASDPPMDPASALAREQLERAHTEVRKLEDRRSDLESRVAVLRARVEDTPRTEQELANLKRDYDNLNENYKALLNKQLEAQMAGRLEQRWRGDRFRMLDPASLPEKPYFPKAPLVVGMGIALGLFVGLAASLVAEFIDPTVKDVEHLQSFMDYPVLARIPRLPSLGDSKTR